MTMPDDEREQLKREFRDNPILAHQTFFRKGHEATTPPMHDEIIEAGHSLDQLVLLLAFRGAGKSTLAEEAIVLEAASRRSRNILIIGSSFDRAADRLRNIKRELEGNELIAELYGTLVGPVWGVEKLILANGVCIQAFGRGMSLRGVKHGAHRPDLVFVDDVEDQEHVASPEARDLTLDWFYRDLLSAQGIKGDVGLP
jgi:hypothetical protein